LRRAPRRRRILKVPAAVLLLLAAVIAVTAAFSWRCDLQGSIHPPVAQPADRQRATASIPGYSRPEDDAFLSYPEWYIVWSYEEKAAFQEKNLPSGFPYFGAVAQYWNSYCCILRLMHGKYAFNAPEQLMLVVIGTSFSLEYMLKGAYEKTLGKLSEWSSGHEPVEEDRYAAKVARDYADFVHIRPFYEFHFATRAAGLWRSTHSGGSHWPRKWERKIFLTVDYTLEAFYCWVIEKLTHLTYGYEPADTYAWVENADQATLQSVTHVKLVRQVKSGEFILDLPRYQEFTSVASAFAERDVRFREIAGNSQIIISVVAPRTWRYGNQHGTQVFAAPILTKPGLQRVIIGCDVGSLHLLLNSLHADSIVIEHIYDY
jgi:hypothetical protein